VSDLREAWQSVSTISRSKLAQHKPSPIIPKTIRTCRGYLYHLPISKRTRMWQSYSVQSPLCPLAPKWSPTEAISFRVCLRIDALWWKDLDSVTWTRTGPFRFHPFKSILFAHSLLEKPLFRQESYWGILSSLWHWTNLFGIKKTPAHSLLAHLVRPKKKTHNISYWGIPFRSVALNQSFWNKKNACTFPTHIPGQTKKPNNESYWDMPFKSVTLNQSLCDQKDACTVSTHIFWSDKKSPQ